VHVTTRFPRDAEARFAALADASAWGDRLHVHGLDFRSLPDVLERLDTWSAGPAFDIVINNAAQTVWRPPDYYRALWQAEQQPAPTRFVRSIAPTVRRAATTGVLGLPRADTDMVVGPAAEPLDLRRVNSWVQTLVDIDPAEMIEVQVVNAIVPFLLVARLAPNLQRSPFAIRFVVNVTAVEGRFDRARKSPRHPHTNMAKAGLDMLTLTAAGDLAARGIHMVAVDPGWMSHEGPVDVVEQARRAGVEPPLDAVDAAARVYDPIVQGLAGQPLSGCLLKNFVAVGW
jgi:NAD(P)-dependent dehydrogenase (short-subunit alcohol dehydrogenase family)